MESSQQLPHEIILEILSRVPSKSLARFRCVCKPWSNLTLDSIFTKLRILHTTIDKNGGDVVNLLVNRNHHFWKKTICNQIDDEGNVISSGRGFGSFYRSHMYYVEGNSFDLGFRLKSPLGIMDFYHGSHVVGSCNGIVCLVCLSVVCLWNPCTGEYKIVKFDGIGKINFEKPTLGFGYDASNNNYILVEFCSGIFSDNNNVSVNIYSLMDITCSTISNVPYDFPKKQESGIFLSGGLHWLTCKGGSESVVCFDIEQKNLKEVPSPDIKYGGSLISLGVLGGQLCVLSRGYKTDTEIWVMKDYGQKDSWSKVFAITNTIFNSTKMSFYDRQYPRLLCFANNGEVLLKDGNDLLLYNPLKISATNLKIHGITDWSERYSVMTHLPSLVSLQSGTYMETVLGVEGYEKSYSEGPELTGDEMVERLK